MIFAAPMTCAHSWCDLQRARCEERILWSTRHLSLRIGEQVQNVASCLRCNVLSSLVPSCANANSRRNVKLSTKTRTEVVCFVMKRADLMRTVSQVNS